MSAAVSGERSVSVPIITPGVIYARSGTVMTRLRSGEQLIEVTAETLSVNVYFRVRFLKADHPAARTWAPLTPLDNPHSSALPAALRALPTLRVTGNFDPPLSRSFRDAVAACTYQTATFHLRDNRRLQELTSWGLVQPRQAWQANWRIKRNTRLIDPELHAVARPLLRTPPPQREALREALQRRQAQITQRLAAQALLRARNVMIGAAHNAALRTTRGRSAQLYQRELILAALLDHHHDTCTYPPRPAL